MLAFSVMAIGVPEQPQRGCQSHAEADIPSFERPLQDLAHIVAFKCEALKPAHMRGHPQFRLGALGQFYKILGMPPANRVLLAARFQTLAGVLMDRFQHAEAWLTYGSFVLPNETLVHQ